MSRKSFIPTLFSIICIAILWQLVYIWIGFPGVFPSLNDLIYQLLNLFLDQNFFQTVIPTLLRGIIGFFISFILAFFFATISTFSKFWKAYFQPFIIITRSVPVISIVLLAILWFLPPNLPIFIAFFTMFPVLYQNILTGLEQTDFKMIEMAQVFGKTPIKRFISIYLPSAKSIIFDGTSTAMGFGWRAVIIGEVLAQPLHGIGTSMKQAQAFINVSELIAWTVIAVGVSYLFEGIIKMIRKFEYRIKFIPLNEFKLITNIQIPKLKKINVDNINKRFNNKNVFESFSIDFDNQIVSCIKGPSGRGKTTLLRLLAKLEEPNIGKVQYKNCNRVAYSFQDVRLLPWLTVAENITYGISKHITIQEKRVLVGYLLLKMELVEHANKFPDQLSGGQQQRVGLARALAARSEILLLDEPLTGLNNALKVRIIEFISEWISVYQPLVVWATHENIQLNESLISDRKVNTREIII